MIHKIHRRTETQKQDNTERKRTCHEKEILPAARRMMDSKRGLDMEKPGVHCSANLTGAACVSRYSGQGRHFRRSLGRRPCCQQDRDQPHQDSRSQPGPAHPEYRQTVKIRGADCPQHGAERPHYQHAHSQPYGNRGPAPVQSLAADEPPDLPLVCARHRIIPKNWVRRATLLFMLLEIIRTPATVTRTARTAATL